MKTKTWQAVNSELIGQPGGAKRLLTPALVLDLADMRQNIQFVMEECRRHGLALRPHAKTHKCAEIALEQIKAGALGVCTATPHETIALAKGGVPKILLTTPVIQTRHFKLLADLHNQGLELMVVVDDPKQLPQWESHISDKSLPVLIDIDIGMGRTGVVNAEQALALARQITASKKLRYAGVQGYSGMVQHITRFDDRRKTYGQQLDFLEGVIARLKAEGFAPEIISGGGTGTFAIDIQRKIFTESQAGSYLFMDVEYNDVELFPDKDNPYHTALLLRTSVVNNKVDGQLTINAGFKSFATDGPLARTYGEPYEQHQYQLYGDEFGRIVLSSGQSSDHALGTHVDLVTPHCDPTINLHDCYHIIDGDTVIDIWPIAGRGVL